MPTPCVCYRKINDWLDESGKVPAHLTPELSRPASRPRQRHNLSAGAEAAKRARLERLVRRRANLGEAWQPKGFEPSADVKRESAWSGENKERRGFS